MTKIELFLVNLGFQKLDRFKESQRRRLTKRSKLVYTIKHT